MHINNTAHRGPRQSTGFTAIEMMIVVTLIGIAAATIMPRISRIVAESRIRTLQQSVGSDLEQAFALAVREHKPVVVSYSPSTQMLSVTDRASGTILKSRYLGQVGDASSTATTVTPATGMTIFPAGLSSSPLTVTVSNGTYTRTVLVTRVGQVRKS